MSVVRAPCMRDNSVFSPKNCVPALCSVVELDIACTSPPVWVVGWVRLISAHTLHPMYACMHILSAVWLSVHAGFMHAFRAVRADCDERHFTPEVGDCVRFTSTHVLHSMCACMQSVRRGRSVTVLFMHTVLFH